jgi:hypothetical protein
MNRILATWLWLTSKGHVVESQHPGRHDEVLVTNLHSLPLQVRIPRLVILLSTSS